MAIPRDKTDLTTILEYGVDQKNRIVYFGSPLSSNDEYMTEFTQTSIEAAIRAIKTMILDAPNKPITINMNSYGGNTHSMLYLCDVIESSPCQFKFYGGGAIMSSATFVMAICDERYLYPNTTIMIHKGSVGFEGSTEDLYINSEEDKRITQELIKIYSENSLITDKNFWDDLTKRDLNLTAHEAVQLGLADEIIKPKKRGNLRKKRISHLSTAPNAKTMKNLIKRLYTRIGVNPKIRDINITLPPKDEIDDTLIVDSTPLMEETNMKVENNNE